jgi:putative heme-binding domain-containing protein
MLGSAALDNDQFIRLLDSIVGDPLINAGTVVEIGRHSRLARAGFEKLADFLLTAAQSGWPIPEGALAWLGQQGLDAARLVELNRPQELKRAGQIKKLKEVEVLLDGGDAVRGRQVFNGRGACSVCHRVGETGGLVGPDLTKIGAVRSGRDLIESLLFPSATYSQGYETIRVTLKNDDEFAGVRVRQFDGSVRLRAVGGAEFRIAPDDVASIEALNFSLMPEGLLNALTQAETRDLFAYLKSLQ